MNRDLPNRQRATPLHDPCGRDAAAGPIRIASNRDDPLDAGATISARDEDTVDAAGLGGTQDLPDMVELLLARGPDQPAGR